MAGIQDILKGASQSSGNLSAGGGYTSKDVKIAAEMERRMSSIEKLVKSSSKHWGKLAEARSLEKAKKSMADFHKQQKGFDKAMQSGNISMSQRIKQYDKLAKSRKKAIDDTQEYNVALNEQRGILGRTQNVLNDLAKNKGMALFSAAVKDAGIVLGDMNAGFNIMAVTGQAQNKTMGELAVSTGNYFVKMRMASVEAAKFGVVAEDSNIAFAKLTQTYGGTTEVIESLSGKWGGMAQVAKLSGLGMADVAELADQGYKRLGETLDDTLNTVAAMSKTTAELNSRFGEGSVNTKMFANAVQGLAYSSNFYNQNTRMLTESLGNELKMQLALGRAPEAALKKAQENMEMAGKVNIIGVMKFRDQIQEGYGDAEDKKAFLANLAKEFGSEGEIIADMLQRGTLQSSESLFAFQKAVKNSTKLRANMMNDMRASAAGGDISSLLSLGLGIDDAQYMIAESKLLATKLQALKGKGGDAQAAKLFGKDWQKDDKAKALVQSVRDGKTSMKSLQKQFYSGQFASAEESLKGEAAGAQGSEWQQWVDKNVGVTWFSGITNSFATITGLLNSLPVALGGVIAMLIARKGLGSALGNMAMPGRARMPGRMGGGGMAGKMGRAGIYGAVAAGVALVATGMFNASEILGKADVSGIERLAAGFGNLISVVTGVNARDAAMGNTGFHKAVYSALGLNYLDRSNKDVNISGPENIDAMYKSHVSRAGDEALSQEEYAQLVYRSRRRANATASPVAPASAEGVIDRSAGGGTKSLRGTGELGSDGTVTYTMVVENAGQLSAQQDVENAGSATH